jgi:hypothetical protein
MMFADGGRYKLLLRKGIPNGQADTTASGTRDISNAV